MKMSISSRCDTVIILLSLVRVTGAFVIVVPARSLGGVVESVVHAHQPQQPRVNGGGIYMSGDSSVKAASATSFLKDLLTELSGQKLLASSSASWRDAIFKAVGAPDTAKEGIVAKAIQDAMSKPDNQFAILMGHGEPFVATFPSDVVDYDDNGTAWVECRLLHAESDALLVTMGISLEHAADGVWLISSLDWQDFRDQFYPGLSGREWLRAF